MLYQLVNGPERDTVASETIRIVIVDDHPIFQAGMRQVLDAAAQITVVAEGASGADALRLTAQHKPDVLVLDVNLPDINRLPAEKYRISTPPILARFFPAVKGGWWG